MTTQAVRRLVVVSNRLPFTARMEEGKVVFGESAGGLVTGLRAYLESLKGPSGEPLKHVWVGWPGGTIDDHVRKHVRTRARDEFHSHPVFLSEAEMDQFYFGFCNKTVWPLFHYFPSFTIYDEESWRNYQHVNEIFADTLASVVQSGDVVWVHDYHLMLLPRLLRERIPDVPIGFFLHIPFPSFEIFRLLPPRWRSEILEGLLGADLVGFHTYEYMQHFLQSALRILGHEHHMGRIMLSSHAVKVETYPMGIDFEKFFKASQEPDTAVERNILRTTFGDARVILSVDRLDYSKGILNRLEGFEMLLQSSPDLRGKVVLVMVVVPSRIGVDQYDLMKKQVEESVGRINGEFGSISWTPVIYQYKHVSFRTLVALYSASDAALVTPLRDGMNLIAKEYVASRVDKTGVLILSEMAGAAKELGEAIIVNPNDRNEIAVALQQALEMPLEEQMRRNGIMQDRLRRYDITRWATEFVEHLVSMRKVQEAFYAKILSPTVQRQVVDRYQKASRRLILLDYDGTLVPLARRPQLAQPGEFLLNLLRQLESDPKNSVVVISGREKGTLGRWLGGLPIGLVAEHGIWLREPRGKWQMLKQFNNEWKPLLLPILQLYADRLPGAYVEEKDFSLAWHYRTADPEQAHTLASELIDHLKSFTANIDNQILQGSKVVEVRPAGVNKGIAAMHWAEMTRADFVLCIGDDWTDEDMFEALSDAAVTIKVGVTNTHALYNLRDFEEVMRLLTSLASVGEPSIPVKTI